MKNDTQIEKDHTQYYHECNLRQVVIGIKQKAGESTSTSQFQNSANKCVNSSISTV
jgi:hypothetical protein